MFEVVHEARLKVEEACRGFDPSSLSSLDASRLMTEVARLRRLLDGLFVLASPRAVAGAVGGDQYAARTLAGAAGVDTSEVNRAIETGRVLQHLPVTTEAVLAGKLSAPHAGLIADAVVVNPEAESSLIATAVEGTQKLKDACVQAKAQGESDLARARRHHRERCLRMWTDRDGMLAGHFRLPPEIGASVKEAIDDERRRVFRERRTGLDHEPLEAYAADALCRLLTDEEPMMPGTERSARQSQLATTDGEHVSHDLDDAEHHDDPGHHGPDHDVDERNEERDDDDGPAAPPTNRAQRRRRPKRQRPERTRVNVHIFIDLAALRRGQALPGETCEIPGVGPVSVAWVRAMLDDAFVTAIIGKGKDITTVTHLGRHIPAELKTAILAAGWECSIEGCNKRDYLEIDHEHEFAAGGPTQWGNLDPKCSADHARKTRGWIVGPRNPDTGKQTLTPPPGWTERPSRRSDEGRADHQGG